MTNEEKLINVENNIIRTVSMANVNLLSPINYFPFPSLKLAVIMEGDNELSKADNDLADKALAEAFVLNYDGNDSEGLKYLASRLKELYDEEYGDGAFAEYVASLGKVEPAVNNGVIGEVGYDDDNT